MESIALEIVNKDIATNINYCVFGKFGGIIGSSAECQFIIQDSKKQVAPRHCKIAFSEGCFVLSSLDGEIFYNGAFSAIKDDEVALNIGDTIKIGDIELVCVNADSCEVAPLSDKKILDKIDEFNNLDDIKLTSRGQIGNAMLLEKDKIKDVIDKTSVSSDDFLPQSSLTRDDLLALIVTSLRDSKIPLQMPNNNTISIDNIESLLDNEQLIESKRLINLIVLSILLKELNSPLLSELQGLNQSDIVMDYISSALNDSICGKKDPIEALIIKALKSYID